MSARLSVSDREERLMSANHYTSQQAFPNWQTIEETGAGDGLPTECERCGNSFNTWVGVTICYICEDELRSEG